jgi:hypothetical protein
MTYRFALSHRFGGFDIAECNGLRAISRNGAEMELARMLIAAGHPDGPWEAADAKTCRKRLYGGSIARLAQLTISEGDAGTD